ncbi:MAG: UDP-glucose/GDP-mannose dehydrogenase family protein, partial [Actinobacteria bacterium]|nr:UDP-glucose/GDP-mannose dehydrogenase family protein [Actinomycetota bacterium]
AIGYDPRIGHRFLQAGIGFGGGCLPKDIRAFMASAEELGARQAVEFLREIDAINLRARSRVIEVIRHIVGEDLQGKKIAVLGIAFKPESDDIRDSPSLDIASQLLAAGASVTVHDPKAMDNAKVRFPGLSYAHSARECITAADLVLHLTEWAEYRAIDPFEFATVVNNPIIFDGRNALDRDVWVNAGWTYHSPGRTST